MKKKFPVKILFWKRNIESVERIDEIVLERKENESYIKTINGTEQVSSKEEFDAHLDSLMTTCDLANTEKTYQAFLYENNPKDFAIKFFLCLYLNDHTYLAIKGLMPFKQPHYQDIVALFAPYFEK